MNVILWIIFGAIVGWITAITVGTTRHQHYAAGTVIGISGGLIGGFLMQELMRMSEGLNLFSLITAVGFAVFMASFFFMLHDKHRHRL